jgi:hypothetical protein
MELGFHVQNQVISRFDSAYVVADSRNFLTAKFVFSTPEWKGKTKTAVFKQNGEVYQRILDREDTCLIPWEIIKYPGFGVSVFAGNLITANVAQVSVTASGYTHATGTAPPTPDVYQQLISLIDERRLIGPRGERGKQGLPGPPGSSEPPEMQGVLSSKMLSENDYTVGMTIKTQEVINEEVDAYFHVYDVLHGAWWGFDYYEENIVSIIHLDTNEWPHRMNAIPTDITEFEEITFDAFDSSWRLIEAKVDVQKVEPFTTVEGFNTHKISGTVTLESEDSTFDFSICIGFRLSPDDTTKGYLLPKIDESFQSSIWFKRTSGMANPMFLCVHIIGGRAENTLPVGMAHRITFDEPLLASDRVNTLIHFPVTIKSPNLTNGELVLPYQVSLLWAKVGYSGKQITSILSHDISCCPQDIVTEFEVDKDGITATLIDRNQYEHWWSETEVTCVAEIDYVEIISRRGGTS